MAPVTPGNEGLFSRANRDKRLVKQVLIHHQPHHWVPMDVASHECKLMEVRKFSSEYHNIDVMFRKPNLELICVYAVQNPFLFGMYELRREQMKMQQESLQASWRTGLKERHFFYPTTFENLEAILRNNFNCGVPNLGSSENEHRSKHQVKLYTTSDAANQAFEGSTNPRILIVGKVLVSLCHSLPEGASSSQGPKTNSYGMIIDTLATKDKSVFYKFDSNEMYPDHVLVYRDMEGPRDAHSSRLTDFIKHCQLSYRSGTRWNPQEQEFLGRKVSSMSVKEDPDEIHVVKDKKRK